MKEDYQVKLDDGHDFHYLEVQADDEEGAKEEAKKVARRKFGRIARFWRPVEATALGTYELPPF